MADNKPVVSVRLDPELVRRLKYLAADTRRPLYDLIDEALGLLLEKYGRSEKPRQKAK